MNNEKIQIFYDHYKETVQYIKQEVSNRNKYCLYSVALLFFQSLLMVYSVDVVEVVFNSFVNGKLGSQILQVSYNLIAFTNWFLVFIVLSSYWRSQVWLERQYQYLHTVEKELEKNGLKIGREGKSYLKNYHLLSDFIHIFYNVVFPFIVILIGCIFLIKSVDIKDFVKIFLIKSVDIKDFVKIFYTIPTVFVIILSILYLFPNKIKK